MCTDSTFAASSLSCEFLTVEQMAERLQVSRATIFAWIKRGILSQGRHFFKRGRVLRFIWREELVKQLLEVHPEEGEKQKSVSASVTPLQQNKSKMINWDY